MSFNGFPGRGGFYNFAAQNQQRAWNNMQQASFSRPVMRQNNANKNPSTAVASRLGPAPGGKQPIQPPKQEPKVANNATPKALMTKGGAPAATKPAPTPTKPTPITAPKPSPITAPKPTPITAPKPAAKPVPITAPKPAPIVVTKPTPVIAAKQDNASATPNRGTGLLSSPAMASKGENHGTMNVLNRFKRENSDVATKPAQVQSGGYVNKQNAGIHQNQRNSNASKQNGPAQNQGNDQIREQNQGNAQNRQATQNQNQGDAQNRQATQNQNQGNAQNRQASQNQGNAQNRQPSQNQGNAQNRQATQNQGNAQNRQPTQNQDNAQNRQETQNQNQSNAQNRQGGSSFNNQNRRSGNFNQNQNNASKDQKQEDESSANQEPKNEAENNSNDKSIAMSSRLGPKNSDNQRPAQQRKGGNFNNDSSSRSNYEYKKRGTNQYGEGNKDNRRDNRGRGQYTYSQDNFWSRLQELKGEQYDLEPLVLEEQKFNAQSRLFCGSLPRDMTVEKIQEMFSKFGELGQVYHNKEGAFAFINFDFRANAEKAIKELAGTQMHGRTLMIRFAAITTGIQVKNLSSTVTNELLYKSFSIFGNIEMCRVNVDDRGKSIGSGLVIFSEKRSAVMAFKRCNQESFFLTSTLRPVIVEPWETRDDDEGSAEANIIRNETYRKERKVGPRFAEPNSYESEYGKRWKQLFDIYKEKKQALENDLKAEMEALEVKMQLVVHQHETEKLRKELAVREQEALELQMGLGAYGVEPARPSMLSASGRGEYDGSYVGNTAAPQVAGQGVKRPYNYYDEPRSGVETKRAQPQYDAQYLRGAAREQGSYGGVYEERSYANVVSGRSGASYEQQQEEAAPAGYVDEKEETAAQPAISSLMEAAETGLKSNVWEANSAADAYSNFKRQQNDYEPAFAAPNKRSRY